jgi:hypothetical protein
MAADRALPFGPLAWRELAVPVICTLCGWLCAAWLVWFGIALIERGGWRLVLGGYLILIAPGVVASTLAWP